jgi:hypothetical protein
MSVPTAIRERKVMRKLLHLGLGALAYATIVGLTMLVAWYVTPGKAWAYEPYTSWRIPMTGVSCCSDQDCGPVQASFQDGKWWANIQGVWTVVPEETILNDTPNPDGNAHVCYNRRVLCFMRPEAKS